MNKEKIKTLVVLGLELVFVILNRIFLASWTDPQLGWLVSYANIFGLIAFVIGGIPIIYESVHAAIHKDFTADILFSIALISELFLQQFLAIGILLVMMGMGEYLEEYTIEKAHGNMENLIRLIPEKALVKNSLENSESVDASGFHEIFVSEIEIGNTILIKEGGRIPVDGQIVSGFANLDLSAITGESFPVFHKVNDWVPSGGLILEGHLEIECTQVAAHSSIEKVISLVQKAQSTKSKFQNIVDRWAQFFAPTIILIATIVGLITGELYTAVTILTVSCPCALVLSVPTAFIASLANASSHGIWMKSGEAIEKIAQVDTIMLDKTGTLTTGEMQVKDIIPIKNIMTSEQLLTIGSQLEFYSDHPIGRSFLKEALKQNIEIQPATNILTLKGIGIQGEINGNTYTLGNQQLLSSTSPAMQANNLQTLQNLQNYEEVMTTISGLEKSGVLSFLLHDATQFIGVITLTDTLRQNVKEMITDLREVGIKRIGVLTGDSLERTNVFAKDLDLDFVHAALTPETKYQLIQEEMKNHAHVAMVGDGINDAPSLALADVGIAIGNKATALTTEQADIILTDANLLNLGRAIRIGKRTLNKSKFNISLAILFNTIGISLALIFFSHYHAASWHIFQSLLVVLNSVLLLDDSPKEKKRLKQLKSI